MERDAEIINTYLALDEDERIEYVRNFDGALSLNLALFFLEIACETSNDEVLRIEVLKVLGLYKGGYNDEEIKKRLLEVIGREDEDDDVKINAINTMDLMSVSDDDVDFFFNLLKSDEYILIKEAAFSFITHHKNLSSANAVLNKLVNDKVFGKSASRELAS
ncbi:MULTISPECIES: HEAT repeat domain-containing protein [Yersinia pseudotuberculosis complex]|uniref:HEAT repeat domain-containing protein n=1 Tax=Yersinia similis TaxID=367190 RepID=A0ABN4CSV2_9GAMM|nr:MULTISPECIES: HEAT repeat domain-containing protein [Yersinia pseudotuberculosis complex]AHK21936.1 hypothetical protein BF17_05780 [Yersinia similis]CFQ73238.1 Uncharacterised protein [Yersinia similis]CFV37947.1 Uncharacterised protein [Yersinia pseudotuberculosis]CNM11892.1 Uncharacterised protein [Yersinia pseudotuberculosis]SUB31523.1 Uncharacterised protein [Yersinia pseudotuberculosis]